MLVGAVVVAILSVAVMVLLPLCASGRIPRNPFIGIRVPAFFISADAWKAGHRAVTPSCVVGASLSVIACILIATVPELGAVWLGIAAAALLVGVVVGAIVGIRAAQNAA